MSVVALKKRKQPEQPAPPSEKKDDDDDDDKQDDELLELLQRRKNESARLSQLYAEFAMVATEEQLERFEHYKRSRFPRAGMRRLMNDYVGTSSERCAIILVRPHISLSSKFTHA